MRDKTILFSGRFDRPHLGHFLTIRDLAAKYSRVLVVMLSSKESYYSLPLRMIMLKEALLDYANVEVVSNKTHFGKITKEELNQFRFDVYGSGNKEVLKHVKSLGVECACVPRAYSVSASEDIKYQKIKKVLED